MEKIWYLMPEVKSSFLNKLPKYNQAVLQLLYNRGLKEDEIEDFLNPEYDKLFDPYLFKNMAAAVDLIISQIKKKNKIVVYGDYDADGVTAAALVYEILRIFKARVDIYIPYRVTEGYGLNKEAIDKIFTRQANLIITVDNGIRNKEEVKYAKAKGMEVIVADHHPVSENKEDLPECLILNPLIADEPYPYKNLAGVGVAFKLVKALIGRAKLTGEMKHRLEERSLDLVAIGTVADCVSNLGENRIILKRGLEILNNTKRLGLKCLIAFAKINNGRKLDTWNIGFQIAPRLNAAGRMEHANTAFKLLVTRDKIEAEALAKRLNDRNAERQIVSDQILAEIESAFLQTGGVDQADKIIIGVSQNNKAWNEGVIGLVAGRLCEKYYRPALVIAKTEDGYKGSGRSVAEFNLIKAIEKCGEYLTKYGGHPMACGFSLNEDDLDKFKARIRKIANQKLAGVGLHPKLTIDMEVRLTDINEVMISEIEKLAPFGQDNPRPKFLSKNILIRDVVYMGLNGQHLKLRLENNLWAVGFGRAEEWKDLKIGDKIDLVYYLERNEFNGRTELQLKIVDARHKAKAANYK